MSSEFRDHPDHMAVPAMRAARGGAHHAHCSRAEHHRPSFFGKKLSEPVGGIEIALADCGGGGTEYTVFFS